MARAVSTRTTARPCLITALAAWVSVSRVLRNHRVAAAAGTLPRVSQPVIFQSMFLFLLWTQTPLALVMAAYSRSVPTAVAGLMPNHSRMGVISEPPPTPVMPTMNPTTSPAKMKPSIAKSIVMPCGYIEAGRQHSDFSYNVLYRNGMTLYPIIRLAGPLISYTRLTPISLNTQG
ncbi:hypothetical protein D3C80_1127190 [compost metagenome]